MTSAVHLNAIDLDNCQISPACYNFDGSEMESRKILADWREFGAKIIGALKVM